MLSARVSAVRRVPAFARTRLARMYSEGDVARSKEFSCVFKFFVLSKFLELMHISIVYLMLFTRG